MKFMQSFCIVVCLLITACDDKVQTLDIEGTWWVTLGFDSTCEVGVSFSEDYLSMIFNDLEPDGCWLEDVPNDNNVWVWDINTREDVMLDSGYRQVTLAVSDGMTEASVILMETDNGLTGTIGDNLIDPFMLVTHWITFAHEAGLEALAFPLVRMDNGFESSLMGMWQGPCELTQSDAMVDALCDFLEFQSLTQVSFPAEFADDPERTRLTQIYGVKRSERNGQGQWRLIIYFTTSVPLSPDFVLTLDEDTLMIEPRDPSEFDLADEPLSVTLRRAP